MTRILLTGANSFIGNNFRTLTRYHNVEEISLFAKKPDEIEFGNYNIVIHLAAIVHQSKKKPASEYFRINRDLCLQVARHAKRGGVRQFIFLSTLKVYSNSFKGFDLRDETSECHPDDSYGQSKYEAEVGLKKLENDNFVISIIRLPLVYGYGVKANMLSLIKLIEFLPVLPFGGIDNRRNFIYIKNLVGFIDRIIELKASGLFLALDESAISTTELIICISEALGRKVTMFKLPDILIRWGTFIFPSIFERLFGSLEFDNSQTRATLSYKPPISTTDGLKEMITCYLSSKNIRTR